MSNVRSGAGELGKALLGLQIFSDFLTNAKKNFSELNKAFSSGSKEIKTFGTVTQIYQQQLKDIAKGGPALRAAAKKFGLRARGKGIGNQMLPPQTISTTVPVTYEKPLTGMDRLTSVLSSISTVFRSGFSGIGAARDISVAAKEERLLQPMSFGQKLGSRIGAGVRGGGAIVSSTTSAMTSLATLPFQSVKAATTGLGNFMTKIGAIKPAQAKALSGAMSSLGSTVMGGAAMMAFNVIMQLMDALNPFKDLIQALTDIFGIYGEILGTSFTPLIEKLFEVMLSPEVITMMQQIAMAFTGIVIAFLPLIDIISPFASILMAAFIIPLQLITPIIQLLGVVLAPIGGYMSTISETINSFSIMIGTILQPVIESIMPYILQFASGVGQLLGIGWNLLTAAFQGISDAWTTYIVPWGTSIIQFFKNIINGVIGIMNAPIEALNKIPGVSIATIPYLATGGIVTSPTIAMIGENGPEAVIPLNSPQAQNYGGGGGVTINVYGDVTDEKLQTMQRELWIKGVF